jgi:aryl-alcohol dehydrogenase-like predicted oxidoreductase
MEMQYTNLGNTGLVVSRICLGAMNFGAYQEEATDLEIQ